MLELSFFFALMAITVIVVGFDFYYNYASDKQKKALRCLSSIIIATIIFLTAYAIVV